MRKHTIHDIIIMKKIDLKELGALIKNLRENKKLTQQEFADLLDTSQPVIARIENGEQNLTTETLNKISQVLGKSILSISSNTLDFEVRGGKELSGIINTNTSKNGAMGLLCASLLNHGNTTLHGIPKIEEVFRIIEVLNSIGVKTKWEEKNTLTIHRPKELQLDEINKVSASKTRTILMFIGALIHEYESFSLPHSQGCTLGTRTITPHLNGLRNFGINIEVLHESYEVKTNLINQTTYPDVNIIMTEASDTGAELLLIAAAKYPGKTTIKFAPSNYMVQEVCYFLTDLGIKIEGIGTHILTIVGQKEIKKNIEYYNSEDPIETMMFISLALCTKSELTIARSPIDYLEIEIQKLKDMGAVFSMSDVYKSKNGRTNLVDLVIHKSPPLLTLSDKISCGPYPALNIDNLPFFVPICAIATGKSLIHDWVYENRAIYFTELNRLGMNIALADPHRVFIEGQPKFKPAQVVCPPALRPAMIILIGMLSAEGVSILRNVYSIERGYEEIATRLNSLGADIRIL
jgi:UDP-N-acetylglucosamine 1-carboxyvinyltransferase